MLPQYRLTGEDATYPGHGADFCRSHARLSALAPDVFLSNHGSMFGLREKAAARRGGDARAFVDPARYRRFLERAGRAIDAALEEEGVVGGCAGLPAAGSR